MIRPALAALVACTLVATACSTDDTAGTGKVGFDVRTPESSTTVVPGASGDGSGEPSGPGAGGSGGSNGSGQPPAGSQQPGGDGGTSGPSMPSATGPPGSFAPAYLRPAPVSTIVIELHSHDGAGLRSSTVDHLVATLGDVTGKSIAVEGPHPFSDDRTRWSGDEIRALADRQARRAHGGGVAVMRVALLRGEFEQGNVIGVAVRGAVMAIFVDEVRRAGSVVSGSGQIEMAVVTHEAGHLMGLVDLYLNTGRQDPEHPGHSTNDESVMYWAVESSLVGELLGAGPPTEFDQADRRDLAAIAAGQGPG